MAEIAGHLARRWSAVVWLGLGAIGLTVEVAAAEAGGAGVAARVGADRGVLLIHGAGLGTSVADLPGPSVIVRLVRPPSGRPLVVREKLSRWLEDIVIDNDSMVVRGQPNVVIRKLPSEVGTIALELRDRHDGPPKPRAAARRVIADGARRIRMRPLAVEPAAGPSAPTAPASMPVVKIDGPGAVFEREGVVWIAVRGNRPPTAPEPGPGLQVLEPAAGAGGHALRLRLIGLVPVVRRDGDGIRMELRPGDAPMPVAASDVHEAAGTTLRLHDPDVGDELEVELARKPHTASPIVWSAPGIELLPSWLGRAVRRTSETAATIAAVGRDGAGHSASHPVPHLPGTEPNEGGASGDHAGLSVPSPRAPLVDEPHPASPEHPAASVLPQHAPSPAQVPVDGEIAAHQPPEPEARMTGAAVELHLSSYAELDEAGRTAARRRALAAVAADPAAAGSRLELAQLLLADGMATEAAAVLEAPRRRGQTPASAPGVQGAIAALDARTDEASRLLGQEGDGVETALWRAFVAASRGEPDACIAEWERSGGVLWRYPEPLRRRLAAPIAACILDAGRIDVTLAMLDRLEPSLRAATAKEQAGALHLQATALARDGRWMEARRAFAAAIEQGDLQTSIRAAFDRVLAAPPAGQTPAAAAFEELAGQAAAWRGHPDEPLMLDRLARMAGQAGRPAHALTTWRRALDRAPDHPALAGALEAMQEVLGQALGAVAGHGVENGDERGTGGEAGPISALALAMSWRTLPWTEEMRERALRVADLAADRGAPRAALALGGEAAAAPRRARWQLLAGDLEGALTTMRSAPTPMPAAEAAVAAGRLDEALALLEPPRDAPPAAEKVGATSRAGRGGNGDARKPLGPTVRGSADDRTSSLTELEPAAEPRTGPAASRDGQLIAAADALAAIEGPTGGLAPKLTTALTALRETLDVADP